MLISKYKHITECKRTDAYTPAKKNSTWVQLTKEFNCNSGHQFRAMDTIKRKYENMKKRARQKFADEKANLTKTGGGPYKDIKSTETDEEMKKILGKTLTGYSSRFDDDAVGTNEFEYEHKAKDNNDRENNELQNNDLINSDIEEPLVENTKIRVLQNIPIYLNAENIEVVEDTESHSENQHSVEDWSQYAPNMLKRKKTDVLENNQHKQCKVSKIDKTGKALENKLLAWTKSKIELVDFQKQFYLEEQKVKLEQLQEKHKKSIEHEEQEFQERIKAIREEHQIKMDILQLEKKRMLV